MSHTEYKPYHKKYINYRKEASKHSRMMQTAYRTLGSSGGCESPLASGSTSCLEVVVFRLPPRFDFEGLPAASVGLLPPAVVAASPSCFALLSLAFDVFGWCIIACHAFGLENSKRSTVSRRVSCGLTLIGRQRWPLNASPLYKQATSGRQDTLMQGLAYSDALSRTTVNIP